MKKGENKMGDFSRKLKLSRTWSKFNDLMHRFPAARTYGYCKSMQHWSSSPGDYSLDFSANKALYSSLRLLYLSLKLLKTSFLSPEGPFIFFSKSSFTESIWLFISSIFLVFSSCCLCSACSSEEFLRAFPKRLLECYQILQTSIARQFY